jgi:hypothetical protein
METTIKEIESNKERIRRTLYTAIGDTFNQENNWVLQELEKERQHAIELIAEENKAAIRKIVEDEKKAIWLKAMETRQSDAFNADAIKNEISRNCVTDTIDNRGKENNSIGAIHNVTPFSECVELEILPPRDQNEIDVINTYLKSLPEVNKVELITLTDKSTFNVMLNQPANLIGRLENLRQIIRVEEISSNGHQKMKVTLLAASKIDRNHVEINARVNKIFTKKK